MVHQYLEKLEYIASACSWSQNDYNTFVYAMVVFRGFSYVLYSQVFHLVDGAWGKRTSNDDKKNTRR